MSAPFSVLDADPPWKFGDALPGRGRGATSHYDCLSIEQIKAIELPPLADDAVLLLWRVAAMQEEALEVVRAWGFTPKSEIVWEKTTATGKAHFGMGRSVRASHEVCILATRGRWQPKSRSIRSRFEAPVGRHSEKPEAFYALVEELAAGPYARLFARAEREGWTSFGDELEKPLTIRSTYPRTEKLPVSELVLDPRCQARADVDHDAVTEYRDAYATGADLPPPKVYMVSGKAYVVDGYHRVPAAILAKKTWLRCDVIGEGSLDDAVWYAAGVNQAHGVRRTNADKRRAVRLALETPAGAERSSRAIADHVGVSHVFAEKIRSEWEAQRAQVETVTTSTTAAMAPPDVAQVETVTTSKPRRVGKDGKSYPTKAPSARVEAEPEPADPFEDVPALADDIEEEEALETAPSTEETFEIPNVGERLLAAEAEIKRARLACRRILGEDLNAHAQAIETALKGAESRLRYAVPETCSACGGEGCKWCADKGWLTRGAAEQMRSTSKALGREVTA